MSERPIELSRRALLQAGALTAGTLAMPAVLRAQAPVVKVGILQPLTGTLAYDGQQGRMGAELAIRDINAAGGIKALGGARL